MTELELVLVFLTTTRLTLLITRDRITLEPRVKVYEWLTRHNRLKLRYLITCPWCASIYTGLPVSIMMVYGMAQWLPFMATCTALSASYVTGFLSRYASPNANPKEWA